MMKLEQFLMEFELYETAYEYELVAYKDGVTFYGITYYPCREFITMAYEYLKRPKAKYVRFTFNGIEECTIRERMEYRERWTNKVDVGNVMPATLNWVEGYADDPFYRTICKYCMYPKLIKQMNCGLTLTPQQYLSITEALTDEGWENLLDELKVNRHDILNDALPLVRAYATLSLVIKHEIFRL